MKPVLSILAGLMLAGWLSAADGGAGVLGPDVREVPAGGGAAGALEVTGAVGLPDAPAAAQTVYVQPRFGIVRLTTTGKQTVEVGAPGWQWPQPTLTMPAPAEFLGGHAPSWRAVKAAQADGNETPPPSLDLIGSAGKREIPAAHLAWHRKAFADPAALTKMIATLNARDAQNHPPAIQFYFHTIELGVIDPTGGLDGAAKYGDCFVAVEARPFLVGGGFEVEPVMILNQPVKEVQARYWLDCGFAEPVQQAFVFTTLRKIKMQLPQRRRNFLGFLHWLNGDWLEIEPDAEVAAVKPIGSLDFDTEAGFLAALQAVREQFKDKKPQLKLVKVNDNLRDRIAKNYAGMAAEKE